jgi:anti-sigma B factor antagonist
MELKSETLSGGTVKVVLRGRLDTTGAIQIEMPLSALAKNHHALVVDLSEVTFLASYGIRVLLIAAKTIHAGGGKFAIACPAGHAAKVLQSTRAGELIPLFPTPNAALRAVS